MDIISPEVGLPLMALNRCCRNGYKGVGGRDYRLFQGVGATLFNLGGGFWFLL